MKIKKILASILALTTIICASNTVLAVENTNTEIASENKSNSVLRYAYITSIRPTMSSSGSIKVTLTLGEDLDYSLTLELQEYDGTWDSIDSWSQDGTGRGSISETCSLESGKKYRAKATVEVYDGSGRMVESTTKYSTSVTAR